MSYNQTIYKKLRSMEVPRPIALALADDNSPVKVIVPQSAPAAIASPGTATASDVATAYNSLRTALIAAGVLT